MQTYPTGYAESHRMAEQIFREILPQHGMAVREEQISFCHEVLDTLYNKEISLCEAGVGTGKTLAYLVACILWQMHRPDKLKMPIVISTASVALQEAILTEYLPGAVRCAAPRGNHSHTNTSGNPQRQGTFCLPSASQRAASGNYASWSFQ